MSDSIHILTTVEQDGELHLVDLPVKQGQTVELSMRIAPDHGAETKRLSAHELLASGIIGLWKDRKDIGSSAEYARQLRTHAEQRER